MKNQSAAATVILGGLIIALVSFARSVKAAAPNPVEFPEMVLEFEGLADEQYGKIVDALDRRGKVVNWSLGSGLSVVWIPDSQSSIEFVQSAGALVKMVRKS